MKTEIIERAKAVDVEYFGDVSIGRSVAVIASQVSSMIDKPTEGNVRIQAGDLLFALVSLMRNQNWSPDALLDEATSKIQFRRQERHYYEAHVTIEPVFEDRLEKFKTICKEHKFHVATLLMQKRKEDSQERSKDDSFCTGRGVSYTDLKLRMTALAKALKEGGFKVWRCKIESTLLDSRYDETLEHLLDRDSLPEKERNPRAPADGAHSGRG